MTVGDLLNGLVRVNLAAGVAVLGVAGLRKLVRRRFGARLVYKLWLLPVLAGGAVLVPIRHLGHAAGPAPALPPTLNLAASGFSSSAATLSVDPIILAGLWLFGVAIAALGMAHLQDRFDMEAEGGLIGPAVVGVISPRIIVPNDFGETFSGDEQVLVLAHEQAHIARQDSRLNGLSAAVQCLFWFNPLVHLAAHLMRIDQEMACDETVIDRFPQARGVYARALIKAQLSLRPLPLGCPWPSGSDHPLLERIGMLKGEDLSPGERQAGASALALLCAAASLTAWVSQPGPLRILAPEPETASWPTPGPDSNAAPSRSVTGSIAKVNLGGPWTDIWVRDNHTRQILWVHTNDAETLARETRRPLADTLKPGVQIAVHGYGAPGRPGIYVEAKQIFTADGSPMFPSINDQLTAQARLAACGQMPDTVFKTPPTDAAKSAAIYAWQAACDAKAITALGPPGRQGRPA